MVIIPWVSLIEIPKISEIVAHLRSVSTKFGHKLLASPLEHLASMIDLDRMARPSMSSCTLPPKIILT